MQEEQTHTKQLTIQQFQDDLHLCTITELKIMTM